MLGKRMATSRRLEILGCLIDALTFDETVAEAVAAVDPVAAA